MNKAAPTAGARPPRSLSLFSRLFGAIGLILASGGLLVTAAAFAYGHQAARTTFDRLLIGAAGQISASISIVAGEPLVDLPVPALELLALAGDDRIAYSVIGADGATLTGHEGLEIPALQGDVTFFDGSITGEAARFVAVRRHFAERGFRGTVATVVGHTSIARNALAWDITRNAWFVLGIAGIGMVLLAVFAVRSSLMPLKLIETSLLRRDPKDLTPLGVAVPRELRAIVEAINGFMARINRQIDGMQNLISDSAHQLRTPIAALRAQAELATEESDPAAQNRIVTRVHAKSVELSRLTDQMLSRALVIHRGDSAVHGPVDLRKVAISAAEAFDDGKAFQSGRLRLDIPSGAAGASGDALSLTEAAKNLISNALHHGRGTVTVRVSARNGMATLSVHDQGPGLTPDAAASLGRRFSPGENQSGGAGIGLSIAAAVARAHDTELTVLSQDKSGFEIGFALPLREAAGS